MLVDVLRRCTRPRSRDLVELMKADKGGLGTSGQLGASIRGTIPTHGAREAPSPVDESAGHPGGSGTASIGR